MIEVHDGKIEKFVEQNRIDVVVNAARPSLMGAHSAGSVDYALHKIIDEKEGRSGYFKEKIKEEFEEKVHTKKENVIRCNRGEAVITEGGKLCKYVIHTVGPKSDRRKGRLDGYSSS